MLYLERIPSAPLAGFVSRLWYARAPGPDHHRQRILPTGRVQVILNLENNHLHDCPDGEPDRPVSPALVVGARSVYELVSTRDMADLIGVVFEPGGFACFVTEPVDLFTNRSVDLEAVWGASARGLRERLLEERDPLSRLCCLDQFLLARFAVRRPLSTRAGALALTLARLRHSPSLATVREMARGTGLSERRFSQIFREQVGFSPKAWCRIQRFQRAVRIIHSGADVRWAELSLDCGFYDQAHFANEFRAFSGVDATTYSSLRTQWANHISVE
jgi:AraC-like DNA-binding protein